MASVNKVILVGRIGRDPEVRYAQSGQPVASLSVSKWKANEEAAKRRAEEMKRGKM